MTDASHKALDWSDGELAPISERRQAERRADVLDMGSRMGQIETKVDHLTKRADETADAIVRVHERIDSLSREMQDRLDAATAQMQKTVDDHIVQEQRINNADEELFETRLQLISQQIAQVQKHGDARLDLMMERFDKVDRMATMIGRTLIGIAVSVVGYVAAFIGNHFWQLMDMAK